MWWGSSGKKWTDTDRLLTLALTAYEDSKCPGCGQPVSESHNPDSEGWYEKNEIICHGCAELASNPPTEQKKPTPGAKTYVVNTRPADNPLRPLFSDQGR